MLHRRSDTLADDSRLSIGNAAGLGVDEGLGPLALGKVWLAAYENAGVLDENLVHVLELAPGSLGVETEDDGEVDPAYDGEH